MFLKLCAGRTGQLLNLNWLGDDAGISHNTARQWLSCCPSSQLQSHPLKGALSE